MQIPDKIKIGGQQIKVKITKNVPGDNNGYWDSRVSTIYLHKDLPTTEMQVTFLHEIIHAINNSIDEKEIEYLSQAIYQVMVDNQLFFDGKDNA